ncbi:MAG TPA: hypothetical protein VGM88_07550 [Kofleriaceae bacterium]
MIAALALASCGNATPAAKPAIDAGAPPPPVVPDAAPVGAHVSGYPTGTPPSAYPASRCSECHGEITDEWHASAHSHARTAPLYELARTDACDVCHAPLAVKVGAQPVAREGVTCEACHNVKTVTAGAGLDPVFAAIKYGPLCDAKDHYFHKMGCSPLHTKSEFCSSCHSYTKNGIPVYTEYDEWQSGPLAARACQQCHMPGSKREVAIGAGEREGVANHTILAAGPLRKKALKASAHVGDKSDAMHFSIDVDVTNIAAGHDVPSGAPEHRLVVEGKLRTPGGAQLGETQTQAFGRVLVDASGSPAPFWEATKLDHDDRIAPKATRTAHLQFLAPPIAGCHVELAVRWVSVAPEIAARLHTSLVTTEDLLAGSMPIKAGSKTALKAAP